MVVALHPTHDETQPDTSDTLSPRGRAWRRFRRNRFAVAGLGVFTLILLAAIFAPPLAHWLSSSPATNDVAALGSIRLTLAQAALAARPTLTVGLVTALITSVIGTIMGATSGYFGGWIDALISRLIDFCVALPFMPFAIALIVATRKPQGVWSLIIIFSVVGWVNVARLVRATFLSLREQDFAEAARSAGINGWRIAFRHLLPNATTPILVATSLAVPSFILAEATLDYLTVGITSEPTWGNMIAQAKGFTFLGLVLGLVIPGLCLAVTSIALQLIVEGLRDALDVQDGGRV